MSIFQLARLRRLALIGLYLQTRPTETTRHGGADWSGWFAAGLTSPGQRPMSNDELVAAIVATRAGKRLLAGAEAGP